MALHDGTVDTAVTGTAVADGAALRSLTPILRACCKRGQVLLRKPFLPPKQCCGDHREGPSTTPSTFCHQRSISSQQLKEKWSMREVSERLNLECGELGSAQGPVPKSPAGVRRRNRQTHREQLAIAQHHPNLWPSHTSLRPVSRFCRSHVITKY